MRRMPRERFWEEIQTILERLRAYRPQRVILYGSFARGDDHALSDVDLLIIKETDCPLYRANRRSSGPVRCEHSGGAPGLYS